MDFIFARQYGPIARAVYAQLLQNRNATPVVSENCVNVEPDAVPAHVPELSQFT